MQVLFVCTGNICRSPMAAALLRAALADTGTEHVEVVSSGTWADEGASATEEAAQAMANLGLDLSPHRARRLTPELADGADLIVAMTSVHVREIGAVSPGSSSKTFLAKELNEVVPVTESLEGLIAGARPPWVRALDLDDPMDAPLQMGLRDYAYERVVRELKAPLARLASILASEHG